MKFHKQLHLSDPENGVYGDCQRTVLACLLDLKGPGAVPHFWAKGADGRVPLDGQVFDRVDTWLRQRGYARFNVYFDGSTPLQEVLRSVGANNPGIYYMLFGRSPRGTEHVVVCVGDAVLHDPHPEGGGIVAPSGDGDLWGVEVLVPLRFAAKRALTLRERAGLACAGWRYRAGWLRYLGVDAAKRRGRRWGDRDRRWGPLTYCNSDYHNVGFSVCSGTSGERPYALLRLGSRTLLCELPRGTVRPWRRWVDTSRLQTYDIDGKPKPLRPGAGYEDRQPREYGFNVHKSGAVGGGYDFLSVPLGAQTMDSSTTQGWNCFLPWATYRHVRDTMLTPDGRVWWTNWVQQPPLKWSWTNVRTDLAWDKWRIARERRRGQEVELENHCPRETYRFRDVDGEELTATCRIYESEWRRGEGWFAWLSALYRPRVLRRLDVKFSGETGRRKGSWKGGTTASTGPTEHGHDLQAAFRAYCDKEGMTFLGREPLAALPDELKG